MSILIYRVYVRLIWSPFHGVYARDRFRTLLKGALIGIQGFGDLCASLDAGQKGQGWCGGECYASLGKCKSFFRGV